MYCGYPGLLSPNSSEVPSRVFKTTGYVFE